MSNNNNKHNTNDDESKTIMNGFETIDGTDFFRLPNDLPSIEMLLKDRLMSNVTKPEAIRDFQEMLSKLYNRLYAIALKTDDYNIKQELCGKCRFYGKVIQICQTLQEYQSLVDLQVLQSEEENKHNGGIK